jgi:hypothetical protein
VPVRVRDCEPDGWLGSIVYVDLVGLSQTAARDALLAGVAEGRLKPPTVAFPAIGEKGRSGRVPLPEGGGGDLQRAGHDAHVRRTPRPAAAAGGGVVG